MMVISESYGGESQALEQAKTYANYQRDYYILNYDMSDNLIRLLIQGYGAYNVTKAYIAACALGVDIYDIIEFYGATLTGLDETVKNIAKLYGLKSEFIHTYMLENSISAYEMISKLETYEAVLFPEQNNELLADTQSGDKYPSAPFLYRNGTSESIALNNGALTYFENLTTLPGKNGMDLDLSIKYDSSEAEMHGERKLTQTSYQNSNPIGPPKSIDVTITVTFDPIKWGDRNPSEYMGVGWALNLDRIKIDNGTKYLMLSNGGTYKLEGSGNYTLTNYPLKDMKVSDDNGTITSSKYVLTFADGMREYFDIEGKLIGKKDKFNNTITFVYSKTTGIYTGKLVITDSLGKITTIDYNLTQYKITLPDNNIVTLNLIKDGDYYHLDNVINQDGTKTKYSYSCDRALIPVEPTVVTYCSGYWTGPSGIPSAYSFPVYVNHSYSPINYYTYHNLVAVTYPTGGSTNYAYEYYSSGVPKSWRIKQRWDYDGTTHLNLDTYSFSSSMNPVGDYNATVTNINGSTSYKFNGYHQEIEEIFSVAGIVKEKTTNGYSNSPYPTTITKIIYNDTTTIESTNSCTYDDKGNITSSNINGNVTTFTYDSRFNMLTGKTYKKDASTSIWEDYSLTSDGKDISGKHIYSSAGLCEKTTYLYNAYGNPTSIINYIDSTKYITTNLTYTNDGFVASKTTDGITSNYTYDIMGRIKTSTDGNGNITSYDYDVLGRITKITNPDNSYITNTYIVSGTENKIIVTNEIGNATTYVYDKFGNIKSVIIDGITVNSFTYDSMMRISTIKDSNNAVVSNSYDYMNRITKKAIGSSTDTSLYTESYNFTNVFDVNTSKAIKTIEGDNNAPSIVTTSYYDKFNLLVKDGFYTDVENLNTYTYDNLGNKLTELTAKDKAAGLLYSNKYEYNYAGQVTKMANSVGQVYLTTYDLLGRKTSITDPKGNKSKFSYDSFGRLIKEEIPFDGNYYTVKTYTYDNNGNMTEEAVTTNKPGSEETIGKTAYAYDNRNRLTTVYTYNNDIVENYTSYVYDPAGHKIEMHTANGTQVTKYTYDKFGNMVTLTDPLNQQEKYVYLADGNLNSKTDRNGNVTTYTYDIMGHLLSASVTSNTGIILPEYMQYSYTKRGAMLSEENENLTTVYAYDNLGRIIKETESANNTEKLYSYDLSGNRLSFILKVDGVQIGNTTYSYDNLNRMVTISDDGVLTATYTYDANGNRASLIYSNGITTTYTYNKANLVTELYNKKGTEILSSSFYTYYLDGNQATKTDETGKMTTYEYDGLRRLISETENDLTKTYTYDKASNRSSMTVSSAEIYTVEYTYDANNRLISDTKTGEDSEIITIYSYDNNGNQILKVEGADIYTNEYDAFSRLTSASKNGVVLGSYTYKADGMRLSKTVDGEKTTHIWDGSNIVLEFSDSNDIIDRYIRGINLIKSDLNGFYLYNAHGDVVQLVNISGVVTKNYTYDAFGVEANIDDNDTNQFRYCGEYFDSETGTIYLRARYYDPVIGRFISEDSLRAKRINIFDSWGDYQSTSIVGGVYKDWTQSQYIIDDLLSLNLYTYCYNNPIMLTDPTGHKTKNGTQPPKSSGYVPPKKGDDWNSKKGGWIDDNGNVWVPDKFGHGVDRKTGNTDHWDVQRGDGKGYENVGSDGHRWGGKGEKPTIPLGIPNLIPSNNPVPNTTPKPTLKPTNSSLTPSDVGKVVLITGGGYALYRVARFLPSLFPPLWFTIPANLVCP